MRLGGDLLVQQGPFVATAVFEVGQSLSGVPTSVQGATVDIAGHLEPGRPDAVDVRGGTLTLDIASGSAAIITLDR